MVPERRTPRPVSLVRVAHDDPRLARLLQLYMHEWSALIPLRMGRDGLFVFEGLEAFAERARHAASLFVDEMDVPLGFALTRLDDARRMHVEEFFVLAGARRSGLGRETATLLFRTHTGPWTLTVRPENPPALAFWTRVLPGAERTLELGSDGVTRTRFSWVSVDHGSREGAG